MKKEQVIDNLISWLLNIGTLISIICVLIGGIQFLLGSGQETLQTLFHETSYPLNFSIVLQTLLNQPAIGLIEVGLFSLVATQLVRVGMLAVYYIVTKDYWYIAINTFILLILIYSFIWRDMR